MGLARIFQPAATRYEGYTQGDSRIEASKSMSIESYLSNPLLAQSHERSLRQSLLLSSRCCTFNLWWFHQKFNSRLLFLGHLCKTSLLKLCAKCCLLCSLIYSCWAVDNLWILPALDFCFSPASGSSYLLRRSQRRANSWCGRLQECTWAYRLSIHFVEHAKCFCTLPSVFYRTLVRTHSFFLLLIPLNSQIYPQCLL